MKLGTDNAGFRLNAIINEVPADICETCIHKVTKEDIDAIEAYAIEKERQNILHWFEDMGMEKAAYAMHGYLMDCDRRKLLDDTRRNLKISQAF